MRQRCSLISSAPLRFKHADIALGNYTDYLAKAGKFGRCKAYIRYAAKTSDEVFGGWSWYFREAGCTAAAKIFPKRLSSDRVATRKSACWSLGKPGSKKHIKKLKIVAKRDPHFKIKEAEKNGRVYAYKFYVVREACHQAIGQIQLR